MAAQYPGEDQLIEELVGRGYWGQVYLDIGAFHPITMSNTYCLYQQGWSGDVFEPLVRYADEFKQLRPRDRYYTAAVTDHGNGQAFWLGGEDGAISTLENVWVEQMRNQYTFPSVIVPTMDSALLSGMYSFGSLDVEGHEATIIKRFSFDQLRVGVWMIESIEHRTFRPTYPQWEDVLFTQGYEYLGSVNGQNRFYRHRDYRPTASPI